MQACPQCGSRFSEPTAFCPHDGAATVPAADPAEAPKDPLVGRVIDGRYRVEAPIGEGGMGVVYGCTHAVLGKRLALKVLRAEMARDAEVVQRFIQEAQAATAIGHANIVDISDFGRLPDGAVYFVMELLEGRSLTRFITKGGSLPMATAVHVVRQVASALEAAHARDIVHRDLKPDNIYLVKQGVDEHFVKVLDFGIAKVGGANSKLTRTGAIFGTPHYMSPEQASGQSVDRRTDIYALGVIMYEMFTGRPPFDGETFMGILSKHMFELPRPPSQVEGASGLGALEGIILRALGKKPEDRYPSMSALLADLDVVQAGGALAAVAGSGVQGAGLAELLEPPSRVEVALASGQVAPASGQVAPTSGRGRLALGLVALLVLGGGVGVAVYAASAPGPAAVRPADVPHADPPSPVADPSVPVPSVPVPSVPVPSVPVPSVPVPSVPVPSVVGPVAVELVTDPPGAEVLVDGAMLGTTPLRVPRPEEGERAVTLRLRGYDEARVLVTAVTASRLEIALRAASRHRGAMAPTGPAPATPEATPPPRTSAPRPPSGRVGTEVVDPWAAH